MKKILGIGTIFILSLMFIGCQQPTVNTNANVNTSLDNKTNMNSTNMNANSSNMNAAASISEVKEPDEYQAKVTLSLQAENTAGQNSAFPPLTAIVARDGTNRRMEFTLPNNEKVIYLEANGKNFIVLPGRKQYAELNEQSTGVNVRSLMMPEQIVKQMANVQGVNRAGEETVNGREAIKYTYESKTDTKTQAGNVETESYFLVDKETGLPLRSELVSESQTGNVQGFKGIKVVTEMSDIKTEVVDQLFAEPTDLQKVEEQQIRGQVDLIFRAATAFISQIASSMQNSSAATTNTNTAANK